MDSKRPFHPDIMIAKDTWGDVPLAYNIMLSEVLHYFLETHKKRWGIIEMHKKRWGVIGCNAV